MVCYSECRSHGNVYHKTVAMYIIKNLLFFNLRFYASMLEFEKYRGFIVVVRIFENLLMNTRHKKHKVPNIIWLKWKHKRKHSWWRLWGGWWVGGLVSSKSRAPRHVGHPRSPPLILLLEEKFSVSRALMEFSFREFFSFLDASLFHVFPNLEKLQKCGIYWSENPWRFHSGGEWYWNCVQTIALWPEDLACSFPTRFIRFYIKDAFTQHFLFFKCVRVSVARHDFPGLGKPRIISSISQLINNVSFTRCYGKVLNVKNSVQRRWRIPRPSKPDTSKGPRGQ